MLPTQIYRARTLQSMGVYFEERKPIVIYWRISAQQVLKMLLPLLLPLVPMPPLLLLLLLPRMPPAAVPGAHAALVVVVAAAPDAPCCCPCCCPCCPCCCCMLLQLLLCKEHFLILTDLFGFARSRWSHRSLHSILKRSVYEFIRSMLVVQDVVALEVVVLGDDGC